MSTRWLPRRAEAGAASCKKTPPAVGTGLSASLAQLFRLDLAVGCGMGASPNTRCPDLYKKLCTASKDAAKTTGTHKAKKHLETLDKLLSHPDNKEKPNYRITVTDVITYLDKNYKNGEATAALALLRAAIA